MCTSLVRSSYLQIAWLVTGKVPVAEIRGPIGIVNVIGDVVSETKEFGILILIISFLQLMALISINIGVLQFLPIPALDGGRLLTQFVEFVRRKAITPEKEMYISYAGFAIFILIFILVSFNDIKRWVG
jgi:regulator of sigma E protease